MTVLAGAISGLLSEFGAITLINKIFAPLMKPIWGLPGAAYEGIKLLPYLGQKINFIIESLFGFHSPEAISFPITSLGAVGAAISLVPEFIKTGKVSPNDIAVFTAMGMC